MIDPYAISLSIAALIISIISLRQSNRTAKESNRIAKEANALAVRPILVPGVIEVGKDTWDNALRLKSIRNDGKGPALDVCIRLYQVVNEGLGPLHDQMNVLSMPPGEIPISSCWAPLLWKDLWERDKECNFLTFALTLDYYDALDTHYSGRWDIHAEYGRTTPKSVT